jgi:Mn-dependent DtxR family transcriptional regulator
VKPLVLPCEGAAVAAEALAARGEVELARDVEDAVVQAGSGRAVLTLDACGAACRARLLRTSGVAARALGGRWTRPRPPVSHTAPATRPHSLDDYLLAVDRLTFTVVACGAVADVTTLASHVAQVVGVSRPTAGEMLARLERVGLVRRDAAKELHLTDEGRARADVLLRRRRILECFVATLGYRLDECWDRAVDLARGFDDEALDRLWDRLGRPSVCPHGWPVDVAEARASTLGLRALTAVAAGSTAVVDRLDELQPAELPLGAVLMEVAVEGEGVAFRLDGKRRTLASAAAAGVLVRV